MCATFWPRDKDVELGRHQDSRHASGEQLQEENQIVGSSRVGPRCAVYVQILLQCAGPCCHHFLGGRPATCANSHDAGMSATETMLGRFPEASDRRDMARRIWLRSTTGSQDGPSRIMGILG